MAKIPESTKDSVRYRLADRARHRWPALAGINTRFRGGFVYVDGVLADGQVLNLCRLRYTGYANRWGFAIYRASHNDYEDSFLPTGSTGGPAEEALDTACGLYLADPTAWTRTPDELAAIPTSATSPSLQAQATGSRQAVPILVSVAVTVRRGSRRRPSCLARLHEGIVDREGGVRLESWVRRPCPS
jgi:hypothetical protein